jgi:hypothetical protein
LKKKKVARKKRKGIRHLETLKKENPKTVDEHRVSIMRETQREREREKMLVFSLLSSPLVSGSFLFVFLVPFYSLGLLLGVTVFLLWREW